MLIIDLVGDEIWRLIKIWRRGTQLSVGSYYCREYYAVGVKGCINYGIDMSWGKVLSIVTTGGLHVGAQRSRRQGRCRC